MSRSCSQCGHNGHNSRTCGGENHGGESSIMLFGVRVMTEGASFRKSFSMNNLSQYDQPQDPNADVAAGYESDDVVHASGSRSRERKRGVAWTEEEHKLFLLGLQKVGKGDWRGISRNFVKTRTPTQVASHAQKYFLRRNNLNRRRRRSSLFDITPDSFLGSTIEEQQQLFHHPPPLKLIRPIPIPPSSKMADLNLNQETPTAEPNLPLSLKLSIPSSDEPSPAASTSTSTSTKTHSSSSAAPFEAMSGHGDSIISVA